MTYNDEQVKRYNENMLTLKKYSPYIYNAIIKPRTIFDDIVEWNPAFLNFTIRRNDKVVFVHSQYDRDREAQKILDSANPSDTTIILFGLGDGKILESIKDYSAKLQHLIIVEPNYVIIERFFHCYGFLKVCRAFSKVSLILNKTEEEAEQFVLQLFSTLNLNEQKAAVISTVAYRILYPNYYKKLTQSVTGAIRFNRVNSATMESFRLHWLVNFWRNLSYLSLDLGAFSGKFNGKPAILVSAGPSLTKNIRHLRLAYDKALIVAVGSAISILENNGIIPHFRVAVDAAVENRALFQNVDTTSCPLIYSDHLYYDILPKYQGSKVHMTVSSHKSLERYILDRIEWDYLLVESGFSVANTALDFLCKLGCSKIIFMGQDLCYTEGKLHAEGSWDQEIEERYIRKDIETEDIYGNKVFTDKPFLGMKRIFENTIASYSSTYFINATEGGLSLQGAQNKNFIEVLENDITDVYDFEQAIREVISSCHSSEGNVKEKIWQVVCDIDTILGEIVKKNEILLKLLQDTYQKTQTSIRKDDISRNVRKVHEKFSKLQNNEFYARAIFPVFENKFLLRREAVEIDKSDWRKRWTGELEIMLLEATDIHSYLLFMKELILEYKGEKKLNIIFE